MTMMTKAIKDDAAPTPVANCAPKVLAILPAIKLPKGIKPVAIMYIPVTRPLNLSSRIPWTVDDAIEK